MLVEMKISIIGSGYVGIVTGIGFAELDNSVIFVDIDRGKINTINSEKPPIYERGLEELMEKNRGRYRATEDYGEILETDLTFICVSTPSNADGSINLDFVKSASSSIGKVLKNKDDFHTVVVKSTVVPGTTEEVVKPIIENASGKKASEDFGIAMNPEFLREGNAVEDFFNPDRIVIGVEDDKSRDVLLSLYSKFNCEKIITDIKSAEMIKYASNAFLATKISFANEIGNICKKIGIDAYEVFRGVGLDKRINPSFFRAGIGYGGSCLEGDEKILITDSESIRLISLRDFFEKYTENGKLKEDIKILSFNNQKKVFEFARILSVTKRRYRGYIYEIETKMGCKVKVTEDHPMIVQNGKRFEVKEACNLKIGDKIPVLSGIPENPKKFFDLIEMLKSSDEFENSKVYLRPNFELSTIKKDLRKLLKDYNSKFSYDRVYEFIRRNYLSLDAFMIIENELKLNRSDFRIYSKGSTYVPAIIESDEDFWKFIGYYISEGHVNKDESGHGNPKEVMISFNYRGEEDREVESYLKRLGIKYKVEKKGASIQIMFSSRVFAHFISKYLGCGCDPYSARIPDIAYQEIERNKRALLSGLFRCDGHIVSKHSNALVYGSINKDLIHGIRYLLHSIGIIPSYKTSELRKSTATAHFLRISGKRQVKELKSLFKDEDKDKITKVFNGIPSLKVKNIEKISKETEVYSVEVERNHNFVTTDGFVVHNCFPKDVKALVAKAKELGEEPEVLKAVLEVNEKQPLKLIELLKKHIPDLKGKKIGVLGLAFKPETDDIRETRAEPIVRELLNEGAEVVAYDPKAMEVFRKIFPGIEYASPERVLESDAILIVTEWKEFESLDYSGKIVIDGRRIKKAMREAKIYEGVCW